MTRAKLPVTQRDRVLAAIAQRWVPTTTDFGEVLTASTGRFEFILTKPAQIAAWTFMVGANMRCGQRQHLMNSMSGLMAKFSRLADSDKVEVRKFKRGLGSSNPPAF